MGGKALKSDGALYIYSTPNLLPLDVLQGELSTRTD